MFIEALPPSAPSKLGLVFATMRRPHTAQRLINSIRKYFPDLPIYVADQSAPTEEMQRYYDLHNCKVAWMDFDIGVCASRNAAVEMVKEPYFVLCDDDFFFGPETNFDSALRLLESSSDIGIVGGRLFDRHEYRGGVSTDDRFWELLFSYDQNKGKFLTVPVHYFAPEPKYSDGVEHFECDAVMNFAVFRTEIFDDVIRWDPRFKSNGEHEDFYLNLKMYGKHRVVYTPSMVAYHHHPAQANYHKLRFRNDGWQKFMDKWQIRQFLELDSGLRVTNRVHEVQPYALGYESYYDGIPLETSKEPTPPGHLRISNHNGRIIPGSSKLNHNSKTRLNGHVYVDLDGNVKCVGGSWEAALNKERSISKSINIQKVNPYFLRFDAKLPDCFQNDVDTFCYVNIRYDGEGDCTSIEIENVDIFYSIAIGSDYLVYLTPALIDNQRIYANQWNALSLRIPPMTCDLYAELVISSEGRPLFTSAKLVLCTP